MKLRFKKEEFQHKLETIDIEEQDSITMIELFVKYKLKEQAQEVFYAELQNKEVTTENIQKALYQATLSQISMEVLSYTLKDYEKKPEVYEKLIKDELEKKKK